MTKFRIVLGVVLVISLLAMTARDALACPHGYGVCRFGVYYVCYQGRWVPAGRCVRPGEDAAPDAAAIFKPSRHADEIATLPHSPKPAEDQDPAPASPIAPIGGTDAGR